MIIRLEDKSLFIDKIKNRIKNHQCIFCGCKEGPNARWNINGHNFPLFPKLNQLGYKSVPICDNCIINSGNTVLTVDNLLHEKVEKRL